MRISKMASLFCVFFLLMGTTAFSAVDVALQGPDSVATSSDFDIVVDMSGQDSVGAATVVIDFDNTLVEVTGFTAGLSDVVVPGSDQLADVNANGTFTLAYATINGFVPGDSTTYATISCQSAATEGDAAFSFGEDTVLQSSAIPFPEVTGTLSDTSVTISAGGGSHTIVASATPSEGGSIQPSGNVSVNDGADQTFSVSVNADYTVESVTVDGAAAQLDADNEYTFTDVTEDHTIEVAFQSSSQTETYTITASATPSAGGSITPSGSVSVNEGNDQTFTVALNSGYTVQSVTVDGSAAQLDASNQYTFPNVTADHTIAVEFEETPAVTYNLTVDSAAGGTVSASPAGPTYEENTVVTLTPMPDDCFIFSDWAGADAADVNANNEITMDSDKTVQPVFTANQPPDVPALVSPDGTDPIDPFSGTSLSVDGDVYSDPEGHAFGMTYWRISEDMAGTDVVYEASNGAFAFTVPGTILDSNAEYYWTAQFFDEFGCASMWTAPAVMFNTNVATDADGNGVPDDVESDLTQAPASRIVYQTSDSDETRTVRVTAMGATPAEVTLLTPNDFDAVQTDLQGMGVVETVYAVGFKTDSDQQAADVGNVAVEFDSWPSVAGHQTMLYVYNSSTGEYDEIDPAGILNGSTVDLSGLLADGNAYDADMAENGSISVPSIAVGIVQDCQVSVSFTASVDENNPLTVSLNPSISPDDVVNPQYEWDYGDGNTSNEAGAHTYTYGEIGEHTITLTVTTDNCGTDSASHTVETTEFHDDNCFIATSAAGATGFFGLATLLAGLAGAVAWRKRR